MAERIKGLTVEIGGDTTGLDSALKGVNKELSTTQSELKKVENLLKIDPSNIEILSQKQKLLSQAIEDTESKVETLKEAKRQADEQMANGTEVNQEGYRALQREIASAEQTLEKAKQDYQEVGTEIENAGKKAEASANGGFTVAKQVIANLATQAITKALDGLKRLGQAFLDVGKQALDSYADYEQLKGGVETLFGDDAKTVEEYANKAFETAGLSANEYMETVTSFSASLLQGLNGDTAKSAQIADMAITDMADNANKMGTSMESIQNAYQGFAKQNYTMLDNLKLGYGGTKSEMERLLADAERFSGVKYDISNLSDVYEAIHVVQQEMGITGTTAKEASQTISGSVNAMKSAWKNLLAGMTDENANLEDLINNLVDSALTALDNILPRIAQFAEQFPQILSSIVEKINEHLPELLEIGSNILLNLVAGITQNMPQIAQCVTQILLMLTTTIIQMLPDIVQMGLVIIAELARGLGEALPTLIPTIVEIMLEIVEVLIDNIDLLIDCSVQLMMGLATGLIDAIPILIERVPEIIIKLVGAILENLPKLLEAGIELIKKLWEGAVQVWGTILEGIGNVIQTYVIQPIKNTVTKFTEVGKELIQGIWNGMKNAKDWLIGKVKELCSSCIDAIKNFFGIASPSKVMRDEVGKFVAEGIGVGFSKQMPSVIDDMKDKLRSAVDLLSADLELNDIAIKGHTLVSQNENVTKNYTQTTEIVRQPQVVELMLDGVKVARTLIRPLEDEYTRLGVTV